MAPASISDGGHDDAIHVPVLLPAVVDRLRPPRPCSTFVDVTLGEAGHAAAMLARYPDVMLLGSDADAALLDRSRGRLSAYAGRFRLRQAWSDEALGALDPGSVELILMDLGMCRFHVERSARGFSFLRDQPLDMRFDPRRGASAAELVNRSTRSELCDLLTRYGGDRNARAHALAIERARRRQPIETTYQLARAVLAHTPWRGGGRHPAAQVFQALRVAVNDEVGRLRRSLAAAARSLRPGGRLAVIAFHSIDDGIVKRYPAENPWVAAVTRRPEMPAGDEVRANPASRSARLRVLERLP